jgi:DNA-directed RNA polymerase subunit K/omega
MPKKTNKKASKKEDSDDEYEQVDEGELLDEEVDEEELEDEDDEDSEEEDEKDENINIDGDISGECNIDDAIEDDEEYFENNEETEVPVENSSEFVSKENRVSSNRLSNYELVRILGERIKQLNMGAKPMIKNYAGLSYEVIAIEELKTNMIPFKIKRPLQNGKFEIWTLDELYKDHLLSRLEA